MPSVLTYPGVYVEEIPSGVRTITGVGTSTTAFVGYTTAGPLNKPVRLFSFADFERSFGGLDRKSDLSYAVNQFFQNGGTEAYVVRVAKDAKAASVNLLGADGTTVLTAEALNDGAWGNVLAIEVDYVTSNPDSTFNLTVTRPVPNAPTITEQYLNLSMNSGVANYAVAVVNAGSRLIRLDRPASLKYNDKGWSLSGPPGYTKPGTDESKITGILDGTRAFELTVTEPATLAAAIGQLTTEIGKQGLSGKLEATSALANGTEDPAGTFLLLRSMKAGEGSSVVIRPAPAKDASNVLKLGLANGGREREGAAERRPMPSGTTGLDLATATSPVNGNLTFKIVNDTAAGTQTLADVSTKFVFKNPIDGSLDDALQTALANQLSGALKQAIRVQYVGGRLRVFLASPDYPHATITLNDTAAEALLLEATKGGKPNVQRYSLGVGVTTGSQGKGNLGSDGDPPDADDYRGKELSKTGIYALMDVDLFNLLCIPGTAALPDPDAKAVISEALTFCVKERAFYVVDPPQAATRDDVAAWAVAATGGTGIASEHAAVYWPRIMAADPLDNYRVRSMAASGAIAGVMARTDAERGVWKAPAGTEAALRGTQGLAYQLTDMENGPLNKAAVNALRTFPAFGSVVWGARTRAGSDATPGDYKYVPVRRLALYIEESLFRGTQWVVFEPNAEPLWAQIRLNVGAFMNNLFRQGAFKGTTPAQAYLVRCDSTTTTQNDIDLGIVRIVVGFAPLKPAEFVILQIQQLAGQLAV